MNCKDRRKINPQKLKKTINNIGLAHRMFQEMVDIAGNHLYLPDAFWEKNRSRHEQQSWTSLDQLMTNLLAFIPLPMQLIGDM